MHMNSLTERIQITVNFSLLIYPCFFKKIGSFNCAISRLNHTSYKISSYLNAKTDKHVH